MTGKALPTWTCRSGATFGRTHQQLRLPQLRHPALIEDAFSIQALAVLAGLDTECASVDRLGEATAAASAQHPDHRIITLFVGLADLTGARLLAEIGDDRRWFADARARSDTPTVSNLLGALRFGSEHDHRDIVVVFGPIDPQNTFWPSRWTF
jgi:hypothetical protein